METYIKDEDGKVIGLAYVHHKGVVINLVPGYNMKLKANYEVPKVSRDGS